jgi:hypothetical protein
MSRHLDAQAQPGLYGSGIALQRGQAGVTALCLESRDGRLSDIHTLGDCLLRQSQILPQSHEPIQEAMQILGVLIGRTEDRILLGMLNIRAELILELLQSRLRSVLRTRSHRRLPIHALDSASLLYR